MTPELAQFYALISALGGCLALAIVAARRRDVNLRWRQIGIAAALGLVIVFVLLLAWLAQLAAGEPF